jgi:CubicO group peptidase (beta-lactamase class C family)
MSGIGNFFQPKYRDKIYSFKKISDIMEIILSEPHAFSPGEKMQYSNSGFVVLGALIEEITGQSYEAYIQKNVFDLAKMNSTSFTIDDKTATNYSKGMMRTSGGDNASKPLQKSRTRRALPAGGMFSTAEDLYNFAIALINNDLMSEKTTKIMTSAKPGTIRKSRSTGKDVGYGYGFNVSQDGLRIGHGGGGPGINAELRIWPQTQNIIITLTNLDPPLASNFANKIENYIKNKTSQNLK